VVLVNKDRTTSVNVTVNLGATFTRATLTPLTGPSLDSTTGEMLGGAPVWADGTWSPPAPATVPTSGAKLALTVTASSAMLVQVQ
jgi:hypothetical protein